MTDIEKLNAQLAHLLSDTAATVYELIDNERVELLKKIEDLPPVQPLDPAELEETIYLKRLYNLEEWRDQQLERLEQLPPIEALPELPEPDRHGLPPAGTELVTLPPPFNRHDWWLFTILKNVGEDVGNAYMMSDDYHGLINEFFEFVPVYDDYLELFRRVNKKLLETIDDGLKSLGSKGISAAQMRGIITHSINRVDRFEFEGEMYPHWYIAELGDIDEETGNFVPLEADDPRIKRFKDYSIFDHMTAQILHTVFMQDGDDIDTESQWVYTNIFIEQMVKLAIKDFEAGYMIFDDKYKNGLKDSDVEHIQEQVREAGI